MSEDQTVQGRVEKPIDLGTLRLSEDLVRDTRKVVDHRKRVESLVAAAEEGREQVAAEIFSRVSDDYRRQLDEIAEEYAPLRDRAGEELRRIQGDKTRLQLELDQVNEVLEELRFRCRVGEFDEKELRRREAEKLALVNQLQEQLKTIESTMTTAKDLLGEDLEAVLRGEAGKRPSAPAPMEAPPHSGTTPMAKPAAPPPQVPSESTSPGGVRGSSPAPPASEGTVMLSTPPPAAAAPAAPKKGAARVAPSAAPPPPAAPPPAKAPPSASAPAVEGTVLMSLPSSGAAEAPAPGPGDSSSTQGLPQALLTRKKPDAGKTYVIDKDGLAIGRSNQCDVVVQGATVSRRHAVIRFDNGGYLIEDVSSGGGVLVNGQRQKASQLKNGDEIGIGAAVFEFQAP
ncbi:MAG TPA: FHA domain-containing protein [Thermoanaerobaculia bacterium]|nr:FHA domain-containing protein [Thermoanaerobaculia bacterium]